jgi:hypothetical protein
LVEFVPYVLQILAQLVELTPSPSPEVGESYRRVLAQCLLAKSWESRSHIPSLLGFLRAYMIRDPSVMSSNIVPVLGIFKALVGSTVVDHFGVQILIACAERIPREVMQPFYPQIFAELFGRIMRNKTEKILKWTAKFVVTFVGAYPDGAAFLVSTVNSLQAKCVFVIFLFFSRFPFILDAVLF